MNATRLCSIAGFAMVAGCGTEVGVVHLEVITAAQTLSCAVADPLGAMTVRAEIESGSGCDLAIAGGVASGRCEVDAGGDWSVFLVYALPPNVAVAYQGGSVDLRGAPDSAKVTLDADALVFDPLVLDQRLGEGGRLANALRWGVLAVAEPNGLSLDADRDGVPNLVEACQGTLP